MVVLEQEIKLNLVQNSYLNIEYIFYLGIQESLGACWNCNLPALYVHVHKCMYCTCTYLHPQIVKFDYLVS